MPALANVYRYGSVRQTDTALLAGVIDSLVLRAAIGRQMEEQLLETGMAQAHTALAAQDGFVDQPFLGRAAHLVQHAGEVARVQAVGLRQGDLEGG